MDQFLKVLFLGSVDNCRPIYVDVIEKQQLSGVDGHVLQIVS